MVSFFSTIFPSADKSDWMAQVLKELKVTQTSEDALESLRWHSPEGFSVDPYYTADDLTQLSSIQTIQAAQKQTPGWLNAPEYVVANDKSTNASLRDALTRGADALVLSMPSAQPDWTTESLSRLLNGIKLSETPIFVRLPAEQTARFVEVLKTVAPYQLKGGLLTDTSESTATITRQTLDSPQFRTICASSHAFHNAGATASQELAFTLASLTDTYDQLTDNGLTLEQIIPKTVISLSVGTSYFLEIAKLRALRVLLGRLITAYSSSIHPSSFFVQGQTSTFYDAAATANTNLLRATTEAMAAVIGGCDALTIHPYDTVLGTSTNPDFSARIARNVSILLKDECYLDKVADPAAGSYYIETLTAKLVETAWTLFMSVEEKGGFAKALASGFISAELDKAYQEKVEAVRAGKVLVGVTKFRLDESGSPSYTPPVASETVLPSRRLAKAFE
ncbi:methylmalonyl-CoA mutase family protein [Spirosoma fluviale]|uniref:Heterodimeric methylmalonyl-CoA mutase small subunit n=1 Tax=Spirosoma fluviale TaxID=1597977 RepID=A0A286GCB1_9BACT|nr:methylmalonyl-CoA mutase family protein [Spirosoma fluviale]SOD92624.1 heterodimeric methylmalonyl-CoA mutase small subunit [Spirosoma fluviale]